MDDPIKEPRDSAIEKLVSAASTAMNRVCVDEQDITYDEVVSAYLSLTRVAIYCVKQRKDANLAPIREGLQILMLDCTDDHKKSN